MEKNEALAELQEKHRMQMKEKRDEAALAAQDE